MEQKQVEKFRTWFGNYVAGVYGSDKYINANLKLKEDHSYRTCEQMRYLTNELSLTENQKRLAEVIALFHDVGRFRQFVKYQTYNDPRSVNHCLLGLEVLREAKVFAEVEQEERQLIEKAIEYHGLRELPHNLDGQCLLFSRLIRDTDKLDIFYIVADVYKQYKDKPDEFILEVELPDSQECSAEIIEMLMAGKRIDYHSLRTWNDMKLLQIGWVYDVNFAPTLRRIKQQGFLELIFGFLPVTSDIEKVRNKIFEYIDAKMKQGG